MNVDKRFMQSASDKIRHRILLNEDIEEVVYYGKTSRYLVIKHKERELTIRMSNHNGNGKYEIGLIIRQNMDIDKATNKVMRCINQNIMCPTYPSRYMNKERILCQQGDH